MFRCFWKQARLALLVAEETKRAIHVTASTRLLSSNASYNRIRSAARSSMLAHLVPDHNLTRSARQCTAWQLATEQLRHFCTSHGDGDRKQTERERKDDGPTDTVDAARSVGVAGSALGFAGLMGKRAILFLGGKKMIFGLFTIVSLKKLLFLPAWLLAGALVAGVPQAAPSCKRHLADLGGHSIRTEGSARR
jgi:hypothetical protein